MKLNAGFYLSGVDEVDIPDRGTTNTVRFVRKSVVEQSEADLLKQLELSEDTVEVLEGLLKKAANEIIRLQHQNDLFRWINQNPLPSNPAQKVATWPQGESGQLVPSYTAPVDWTEQGIVLLKQLLTGR